MNANNVWRWCQCIPKSQVRKENMLPNLTAFCLPLPFAGAGRMHQFDAVNWCWRGTQDTWWNRKYKWFVKWQESSNSFFKDKKVASRTCTGFFVKWDLCAPNKEENGLGGWIPVSCLHKENPWWGMLMWWKQKPQRISPPPNLIDLGSAKFLKIVHFQQGFYYYIEFVLAKTCGYYSFPTLGVFLSKRPLLWSNDSQPSQPVPRSFFRTVLLSARKCSKRGNVTFSPALLTL